MNGKISTEMGVTLADILQMVCQSQKQGCIALRGRGEQTAFINVGGGGVLNARMGNLVDTEAITEAIRLDAWEFELLKEAQDTTKRIDVPVSDILLQTAVAIDEASAKEKSRQGGNDQLFFTYPEAGKLEGVFDPERTDEIIQEVDYLSYHAKRIGEALGMPLVKAVGRRDDESTLCYKWVEDKRRGFFGPPQLNISTSLDLI